MVTAITVQRWFTKRVGTVSIYFKYTDSVNILNVVEL